jgi:excisionase family DNA binding protein
VDREKRWMNIREAAKHIGMSVAFLRKATRERKVPYTRIGTKALRFDREALDEWLMAGASRYEVK